MFNSNLILTQTQIGSIMNLIVILIQMGLFRCPTLILTLIPTSMDETLSHNKLAPKTCSSNRFTHDRYRHMKGRYFLRNEYYHNPAKIKSEGQSEDPLTPTLVLRRTCSRRRTRRSLIVTLSWHMPRQ